MSVCDTKGRKSLPMINYVSYFGVWFQHRFVLIYTAIQHCIGCILMTLLIKMFNFSPFPFFLLFFCNNFLCSICAHSFLKSKKIHGLPLFRKCTAHGDFYATTVVERLGLVEEGLVRAGCACYTTDEEIERLIAGVLKMR